MERVRMGGQVVEVGRHANDVDGGKYGGGGVKFVGVHSPAKLGKGGDGAVRITWGPGRSFPSNAGYIAP